MKMCTAVARRINKLMIEKNLNLNQLASLCCLTQSTLESIMDEKSKNPKILTIYRICDGLEMNLKDFFDDELFKEIDRED